MGPLWGCVSLFVHTGQCQLIFSHLNEKAETKQAEQYFPHTGEKEDQHRKRHLRHDSTQNSVRDVVGDSPRNFSPGINSPSPAP